MFVFDSTRGALFESLVTPSSLVLDLQRSLQDALGVRQQELILLDRSGNLLRDNDSLATYASACNPESPLFLFNYKALRSTGPVVVDLPVPMLSPLQFLRSSNDLRATLEEHNHLAAEYKVSAEQHFACVMQFADSMRMMGIGFEAARMNMENYVKKLCAGFESFQQHLAALPELKNGHLVPLVDSMLKKLKLRLGDAGQQETLHAHLLKLGLSLTKMADEFQQLLSAMGEQRNRFHQAVQQIVAQAHSVEEESPIPFSVTHGILSDAKDHFEAQSLVVETILTQCARARDQKASDFSILEQIVVNHLQMSHALAEHDSALRELVRQVVNMKQDLATSIVQRLQLIMNVQKLIKDCKKNHGVTLYFEQCERALHLHEQIERGLRLPHAYIRTLHEIARRIPFRKHYMSLADDAFQKLNVLRQNELRQRRRFHTEHGQYMPELTAFEALDDYPHTCVIKAREFDTNLPSVTIDDVKQALAAIEEDLKHPDVVKLMEAWPSLEATREIDTDKLADSLTTPSKVESELVAVLQEQLLLLHCECEVLEKEKDSCSAQVAGLKSQLTNTEAQVKSLTAQLQQSHQQAENEKAKNLSVMQDSGYNELVKERDQLRVSLTAQQTELENVLKMYTEQTGALEQSAKLQAKQKSALEALQQLLEADQKKIQELDAALAALKAQCQRDAEALSATAEEKLKRATHELEVKLALQQKELESVRLRADKAEAVAAEETKRLQQQLAEAAAQVSQLQQQTKELEAAERQKAQDSSKEAVAQLHRQIKDVEVAREKALDDANNEIARLKKQISDLEAAASTATRSVSATSQELVLSKQRVKQLEDTLRDKVSYFSFQVGDLATFVGFKKSFFTVLTKGVPTYFMSLKCQQELNLDVKSTPIYLARIVHMAQFNASPAYNPYDRKDGAVFYELDVELYDIGSSVSGSVTGSVSASA